MIEEPPLDRAVQVIVTLVFELTLFYGATRTLGLAAALMLTLDEFG